MEANNQRNLYHYFHGCVPGMTIASQKIGENLLTLSFPDTGGFVEVAFDHRQCGVLVAFDGTLLWGSLPRRNVALVYHKKLFDLDVPVGQFRKTAAEEERPQYQIVSRREKIMATVPVYRSIVLLPFNYRTVIRRHDEKSMHPKYVVISTDKKSVVWLTTSW